MKTRVLLATLMATVFASSAVHAANQFWMNYVDSNWDTTTLNWYGGTTWADGDSFIINQSPLAQGSYTVNIPAGGVTATDVVFLNQGGGGGNGFTIAGGTLTLARNVTVDVGMTDTINSFVQATSSVTLHAGAGTLILGGGGNFNGYESSGGATLWLSSGTYDFGTAWTVARNSTYKFTVDGGATVNLGNLFLGPDYSDTIDFATNGPLTSDHYVIASYRSLNGGSAFANVRNLPSGYILNYHYNGANVIALVTIPTSPITWSAPATISGDADISHAGVFVDATQTNFDTATTLTFGDAVFTGANGRYTGWPEPFPGTSTKGYIGWVAGGSQTSGSTGSAPAFSANYNLLIQQNIFLDYQTSQTLSLKNLTVGHSYQVQIWVNQVGAGNATSFVADNMVTLQPGGAGLGQYVLGTFTADAAVKSIIYTSAAYPILNAVQLRDLSLTPVSPAYTSWATSFSGFTDTDPTHDPLHCGMTNQQKYAFGLDPTSNASINPIAVPLNKSVGTFSYTRLDPVNASTGATGLTYVIQTSSDLNTWTTDSGATQSVTGQVYDVQTVQVTLSGTKPLTATKLFVRVVSQ